MAKTTMSAIKGRTKKTEKTTVNLQYPEKYTNASMVAYIAKKHDLPRKKMKEIFGSMFNLVQIGVIKRR